MGTFRVHTENEIPTCDTCGKVDAGQMNMSNHPMDACIRYMRDTIADLTARVEKCEGKQDG